MANQAMSAPSWNVWQRMDFNTANVLWYPQRPLASTDLAKAKGLDDYPMGQNAIVAFAYHGGLNQEDALIVNAGSNERGFLRASVLEVKRAVEKARGATDAERFEHPLLQRDVTAPKTEGVRGGVNFDAIGVDGLPAVGARITDGSVVIGKTMTSTTELDGTGRLKTTRRDRSVVMSCDPSETYYVDKVAVMPNKEGFRMVRVRLVSTRALQEGDKACLTPDHEVLVKGRGFVGIADVTTDDAIATFDPVTETMAYRKPSAVHNYYHDGDMYEVQTQGMSLCTTLNHRMWVLPKGAPKWRIMEAGDVKGRQVQYRSGCMPTASPEWTDMAVPGLSLDTEARRTAFLTFLGLWLAEGWVSRENVGSENRAAQLAVNKPRVLAALIAALEALDIRYSIMQDGTKARMSGQTGLAAYLHTLAPDGTAISKRLPTWATELSAAQSQTLLNGMLLGDGSLHGTTWRLSTSSVALKDGAQILAQQAGLTSYARVRDVAGSTWQLEGRTITMTSDNWCVTILNRWAPTVLPQRASTVDRTFHYRGTVHCVTIPPTETFIVRRHGKLVATLNSARHGQKGTVGVLYRQEDMPFIGAGPNAGMTPDLILNVHSWNGRMTIGLALEAAYGALGLVRGQFVDATPFRGVNARWVIRELIRSGYAVNVPMICGTTGEPMKGNWFVAPCFYQRLKHMVLDKLARRWRGLRAALTRQPMGGASAGQAQRFGEMEGQTLLAHGAAFVADDALRVRSDPHQAVICLECGGIIDDHAETLSALVEASGRGGYCRACRARTAQTTLDTTYCNVLWQREVAAMGIKVTADMGWRGTRTAREEGDDAGSVWAGGALGDEGEEDDLDPRTTAAAGGGTPALDDGEEDDEDLLPVAPMSGCGASATVVTDEEEEGSHAYPQARMRAMLDYLRSHSEYEAGGEDEDEDEDDSDDGATAVTATTATTAMTRDGDSDDEEEDSDGEERFLAAAPLASVADRKRGRGAFAEEAEEEDDAASGSGSAGAGAGSKAKRARLMSSLHGLAEEDGDEHSGDEHSGNGHSGNEL